MSGQNVIAELLIEIGMDSRSAERSAKKVDKGLEGLKKSAEGAEDAVDGTAESLKRMTKAGDAAGKFAEKLATAIKATAGTVAGLGAMVLKTGGTFESLRAQLKTATGSAEGAEKALGFVREFAKNTPFQVEQITEAFVKLTNLGLEPSERALTSYGDTASAMGKSLDQFIEAVADATTGEFERLKEFGIKSRSEGDRVAFTFRGITTEVGKNSKEIQEFLIGIGENNFSGAMAERMETLEGVISNAKDAFQAFLLSVAEMGVLEEFKGLVADLRDASGDKDGLAKILAKTLITAIRALRRALRGDLIETLKTAASVLQFVVENFDKMIFLFASAKTFQGFAAIAQGFSAMGIAATGALGPIGAVASALIALIPIAIDVGNKVGDVLGRDATPRTKKVKPKTFGEEFGAHAGAASRAQADIERELKIIQEDGDPNSIRVRNARLRLADAESRKNAARKAAQSDRKKAARAADQQAKTRDLDLAEAQEFGGFDANVAAVSQALGIEGQATAKQQARLDEAVLALAEGKSLAEARKAAGLDRQRGRGGGRGRRREKPEREITSPTTVSEFFRAASAGELGPIAARTPSTKDIEPTVAVDITNNNFQFSDTFHIKGTADPKATAKSVIAQIKVEFDRRTAIAGQQIQGNAVR